MESVRHVPPAELGEALRAARLKTGMSLRSTARRLGISRSFLSDMECGRSCPSTVVAERLAEVLPLDEDGRAVLDAAAVAGIGYAKGDRRRVLTHD